MFIAGCLAPVAYLGDHSETWAKRMIVVAVIAGVIFLISVFT